MSNGLDNRTIAERLDAFASLLELAGSGFYTARAYRRAAGTIRDTLAPAEELIRTGRIRELNGIGPSIAAKLDELVETGTIAELDELEREIRPDLVGLGRYLGLGPRRVDDAVGDRDRLLEHLLDHVAVRILRADRVDEEAHAEGDVAVFVAGDVREALDEYSGR